MLPLPIFSESSTLVLSPPDRPPNGQLTIEIMTHFPLKALFCPPTIAEMLVREPSGIEQAKNLDFLLYAGGPLSEATGKTLSKVTDVCQFYGQTETGPIQALVPRREDWDSLEWHPAQEVDMQLYSQEPETYEMVMQRNPALEKIRSLSCNFADVAEWHTKDLFVKHPSKANLWRFYGRVDDIIVLSNGEKFNPVPSERIIQKHPSVAAALITGQGRFQPALIIEPHEQPTQDSQAAFLETLWPAIEGANKEAQAHGKISRSMILLGATSKPFARAAKGTVIQTMTENLYRQEIEDLYANPLPMTLNVPVLESPLSLENVKGFVSKIVSSVVGDEIDTGDDLFVHGMDSWQTMEITQLLRAGIKKVDGATSADWVTPLFVYASPSISRLSEAVHRGMKTPNHFPTPELEQREANIQSTIKRNSNFVQSTGQRALESSSGTVVLLTGSTGSLGSHILLQLLQNPAVSNIYCLNRSSDARSKQMKLCTSRGLSVDLPPGRVTFLKATYGDERLGLSQEAYSELQMQVSVIIHNAWNVDFNQTLESFEPMHVRGV